MAIREVEFAILTGSSKDGVTQLGGAGWQLGVAAVIEQIESGKHTFFVRRDGRVYLVTVSYEPGGNCLRVRGDEGWMDVLQMLPPQSIKLP